MARRSNRLQDLVDMELALYKVFRILADPKSPAVIDALGRVARAEIELVNARAELERLIDGE